jgi:hypothetical protein
MANLGSGRGLPLVRSRDMYLPIGYRAVMPAGPIRIKRDVWPKHVSRIPLLLDTRGFLANKAWGLHIGPENWRE